MFVVSSSDASLIYKIFLFGHDQSAMNLSISISIEHHERVNSIPRMGMKS
jgi:hypothetical protein